MHYLVTEKKTYYLKYQVLDSNSKNTFLGMIHAYMYEFIHILLIKELIVQTLRFFLNVDLFE